MQWKIGVKAFEMLHLIFYTLSNFMRHVLKVALSQKMLKDFQISQKIFQKNYLKFVHPVHDIDETSILNFFDFTSLTYLHIVQKGF